MNTPPIESISLCTYVKRTAFFAALNATTSYTADPSSRAQDDFTYFLVNGYFDDGLYGSEDASRVLHQYAIVHEYVHGRHLDPHSGQAYPRWVRFREALNQLDWEPTTLVEIAS